MAVAYRTPSGAIYYSDGPPRDSRDTVIGTVQPAATLEQRQDRLFSEALGGTQRQLTQTAKGDDSTYLRPEQIAQLLQLRAGSDVGQVLQGAPSPSALEDVDAGFLGNGRNVAFLVGGFAALALLLFFLGRGRRR